MEPPAPLLEEGEHERDHCRAEQDLDERVVKLREHELPKRRGLLLLELVGAVLGVLVSISSVGAGALGVTALFFLYPRLPSIRIVASDLAHAVPLTLVAGLGHWWLGSIDWSLLLSLLVGSLPGIYIGSHLAVRISERILRPLLATMPVLIGFKLILS